MSDMRPAPERRENVLSLADFAPKGVRGCGPCGLPDDVLAEVEQHRVMDPKRFTYPVISDWLRTLGHDVHSDALRRHFRGGHVRDKS